MAINPETEYPTQIAPASTEYPYGEPRNVTSDTDTSGTPFDKLWMRDIFGFEQSLLKLENLTPSGNPEEVGASQYLQALQRNSIMVWNIITVYPLNALVRGSDGAKYRCIVSQAGNDPVSDGGVNWAAVDSSILSTIAEMKANPNPIPGKDEFTVSDRHYAKFDTVLGVTGANDETIVANTANTHSYVLRITDTMHIKAAGALADGSDDTTIINNLIDYIPNGTTLDARCIDETVGVSGQSGTSPDDFAAEDGDSSPDAPEDSGILLRDRENITILVEGTAFTTATLSTYIFCFYKSVGCKIVGNATFTQTGTITTEQPTAVTFVRCWDCHTIGAGVVDQYRGILILKCAYSSARQFSIRGGSYFSLYISGLLDVNVGPSSVYNNADGFKWTNWCEHGSVTDSKFGSYFLEWATAEHCDGYDLNNADTAVIHFSSQTGPYRANNCHVVDGNNQNSGNFINGFSISPSSSAVASLAASKSALTNCSTLGCRLAYSGAGFRDVVLTNCRADGYWFTGFAFISLLSGGGSYSIENLTLLQCIAGNIETTSTLTSVGNNKPCGVQLEKNDGVLFSSITLLGGSSDLDDGGVITPAGTAYEVYIESVDNLTQNGFKVLGTQDTVGFPVADDQGTSSATITFGGGSAGIAYTRQNCDWKLRGEQVDFRGTIKLNADKGSSTGDWSIDLNIPYPPVLSAPTNLFIPVWCHGAGWDSTPSVFQCLMDPDTGDLFLYDSNTAYVRLDNTHCGINQELFFAGSYPIV